MCQKKRLLGNLGEMKERLFDLEPNQEANITKCFSEITGRKCRESVGEVYNYSGTYLSYSLSSSTDSLKAEPYLICASENNDYVKVGMINAYKSKCTGKWHYQ